MSIGTAPVQSTGRVLANGVSSITYSLTGVTASNTLLASATHGSTTTSEPAATWPSASWVTHLISSPAGGGKTEVGVLPGASVAAGSQSCTVTGLAGTYWVGSMEEWAGITPSAPVDLVLAATTASGSTGSITPTGTPDTTTVANELLYSVCGNDPYENSGTITDTQPTGYTQLWQETDANNYATGCGAYKVLTAITTVADTWTAGLDGNAITISLKGASGGTTYNQSVSGSITAAGSLQRQVNKATAGSITAAGSLQVQSAHAQMIAGSIVPTGSLLKRTSRGLSGTITAAGSLAKRTARSLTGSMTPAGALATMSVISKAIAGTITAAGSLATSLIPAPTAATLLFHVGHADVSGSGTSPMPTSPVDTPSTVPLIVIAIAGQSDSTFATPVVTDNKGNTYTQVGTTHNYAGITAPTALYKCDNAVGGTGHIFYLNKASATDEATIMVTGWNSSGMGAESYTGTGTYTAGPLTTTGNNSCVASYWYPADYSGVNPSVYYAPSGWTGLDFFENGLNTNSGADAYIAVPASGTGVTATWSSVQTLQPTQGHWLVEILAPTGGTLFTKALSGLITMAGSLSSSTTIAYLVSGTITMAGQLTRRISKSVSGVITMTGQLSKKTARTITGAVAVTGLLAAAWLTTQAVSGSIVVQGAITAGKIILTNIQRLLALLGVGS